MSKDKRVRMHRAPGTDAAMLPGVATRRDSGSHSKDPLCPQCLLSRKNKQTSCTHVGRTSKSARTRKLLHTRVNPTWSAIGRRY